MFLTGNYTSSGFSCLGQTHLCGTLHAVWLPLYWSNSCKKHNLHVVYFFFFLFPLDTEGESAETSKKKQSVPQKCFRKRSFFEKKQWTQLGKPISVYTWAPGCCSRQTRPNLSCLFYPPFIFTCLMCGWIYSLHLTPILSWLESKTDRAGVSDGESVAQVQSENRLQREKEVAHNK